MDCSRPKTTMKRDGQRIKFTILRDKKKTQKNLTKELKTS